MAFVVEQVLAYLDQVLMYLLERVEHELAYLHSVEHELA